MSEAQNRNARIREAHVDHGYSLSEIGSATDLHYSTVSRIVSREEASASQAPAKAKFKKPRTR